MSARKIAFVFAAVLATSASAQQFYQQPVQGQYQQPMIQQHQQQFEQYAQVVDIRPNFVVGQRQVCDQGQGAAPSGQPNLTGSILGALGGAALGSQIGGGTGNTAAISIGTVIGSQLGGRAGSAQPQCRVVQVQEQQGVIVTFQYRGQHFQQVFER
jgi:uncharacterized protein YcfJ